MLIGEVKPAVVGLSVHLPLLLAFAFLRFLNVREIRVEIPCHVSLDRTRRMVADRESDSESTDADRMDDAQR
jgi:hypothetical protein